jgi:hypothetical protein
VCEPCPLRGPCGGVYKEYIQAFGWDEFGPPAGGVGDA